MFKNAVRQLRHRFNRPFMVMFETTLHCNMKCGYCAIWQNQQPEDRAVRERVFGRMDEAADFGVFAWSFSGGEPLMNPNMPDYIDYASRKGFFTSMPTNGLALKKYSESCARLDQLEVSIDTLDREKFAKRRGIDGLPTILDGLDHLLGKYKPNTIQINAAVDLENLEDLPALAEFCTDRNILLHTEAVHNVVRTTFETGNVEMRNDDPTKSRPMSCGSRSSTSAYASIATIMSFIATTGLPRSFPVARLRTW
jgi:MoaA/NifB/PqqE/SkfB family radical SAM enzyme